MRTQQIVAAESGVANTVDPVAGSYAIEALTNGIEQGAADLLARIDHAGGTLAAIEAGLIQREIQESAYRAQIAIDSGESVVVGVNRFAEEETAASGSGASRTATMQTQRIDEDVERRQIERVRAVRVRRSADAARSALDAVSQAARDGSNLVPRIIAAVEVDATVREIAEAMRAVFREYSEPATP